MKNDVRKKKESGKMTGGEFRSCRNSYGMSQAEWADAVGISTALVKMIETGKQECSVKTAEKVWNFMGSGGAVCRNAGMKSLEERILYEIFLGHMEQMDEKKAAGYAVQCVRLLLGTVSKASRCSSPDAQKRYYDFIEMFLSAMNIVASECVGMANDEKPVSVIRGELIDFLNREIKMLKQEEGMSQSGNMDEDGQYCLFS